MYKKSLVRCVCLALSAFIGVRAAHAAVFNIADGDAVALVNAMNTANFNGESDTINLAANGTYTLIAIDNSVNGPNGLRVINNDASGLDLTINGNGATIQRSTAAGTPEFRILQVGDGANVSCTDLTIANGKVSGSFPTSAGAGIYNGSGTLSMTNCTVRDNTGAAAGGGIFNSHFGSLSLAGCTIHANVAGGGGGGLYNFHGTLTLRNSTVSGNSANVGGGLVNEGGDCTVQGNTFSANSAGEGVAIYQWYIGAQLRIYNTILESSSWGTNIWARPETTFTSEGFNLSNDGADGDVNTGPGGLLNGPGDIRNTNPNLGPLQDNGGAYPDPCADLAQPGDRCRRRCHPRPAD